MPTNKSGGAQSGATSGGPSTAGNRAATKTTADAQGAAQAGVGTKTAGATKSTGAAKSAGAAKSTGAAKGVGGAAKSAGATKAAGAGRSGGAKGGASKSGGAKGGAAKSGGAKKSARPASGLDLRKDLRDFAAGRPEGWNHEDWMGFLQDLERRGHNVNDRDQIGMMLERERLSVRLEGVQGLSSAKAKAIAERYGQIWRVRETSAEELAREAGVSRDVADRVVQAVR